MSFWVNQLFIEPLAFITKINVFLVWGIKSENPTLMHFFKFEKEHYKRTKLANKY